MANISALLGGGIKSVQTGTINLAGTTSNTATISSVNTAKAFCIFGGFRSAYTGSAVSAIYPEVYLSNATTVAAARSSSSADAMYVRYTVVEFN